MGRAFSPLLGTAGTAFLGRWPRLGLAAPLALRPVQLHHLLS